jgi:hypothetical protein
MTNIEKEKIIKMVLAELTKQNQKNKPVTKRILAIFSAGIIGLDDVLEQMQQLQKNGYQFEVVLTPNGKKVISKDKLQEFLGQITIYDDSEDFNKLTDLLTESDALLIPVMTMNTAAKVLNGIADNLATTLIMIALLSGKPVIGVRDACDPKNLMRESMGHNKAVQAYKALLVSNVERLEDYGMVLCEALSLVDTVQHSLGDQNMIGALEKDCQEVFDKQIFSLADLPNSGSEIIISPRTIITPAAKDAIKERGMEIVIC